VIFVTEETNKFTHHIWRLREGGRGREIERGRERESTCGIYRAGKQ
jgi:hypothetical protein